MPTDSSPRGPEPAKAVAKDIPTGLLNFSTTPLREFISDDYLVDPIVAE